ncbi:kinase-like protein [Xylona heveae TC161]|uniref:Kinase-like protein n=1 Tax=Xylona heveae (strain CBS 132557 / TC161) TaxID=1328760 RepID=A0A165IA84_XYLHT|nr:kinase-like protein [Xylona heveae TC161]KZF24613.1 kinase-like protein [Xylona heveae TC161]
MQTAKSKAEQQIQKAKLANSYHALLEEFSSKDLRTVGNYSLGRLIGKGSFGKVYLASHKLTNGLKVVLKSADKNDTNLAREIHHHRQFIHPHIARLYEVIVTETLVWLVLEYCPGDELYNYLLRHGPLPVDQVQKIFSQLVGAVAYVHNKSCVHRDLKLENILLDKHGNVKLCDFGFTREYEGKSSYLQTFCGTICYSAPEMLKAEKYAGEKVDVWSLGIILYALLAGELPFDEDSDADTKMKILTTEPKYPDHFPEDAKTLIGQLLSKRPLLRPSLSDVLAHPFLTEYAHQQQATLKIQQPAPFTTKLEKDTLQRMRSAGVDIDQVIENVLAQRCDSLAGWWALLIEKEERKEKRRERKRKEKESEARTLRRLSAASSRLDRIAPTLTEVDEEGELGQGDGDVPISRGRKDRRSGTSSTLGIPELPRLPENQSTESQEPVTPPPPIEKDRIRSGSSSRQRPMVPPKDVRRSRSSHLHITTNADLLSPHGYTSRRARKHQHPFMSQLASIKHWFMDTTKRGRSPNGSKSTTPSKSPGQKKPEGARKVSPASTSTLNSTVASGLPTRSTAPQRPRISTTPHNRSSLSPSPLTPHSSYRRTPSGLRGRKSTSSSVSSIRSMHKRNYSHSKASSTSSASASVTSSKKVPRSPHSSVKVLPATPTNSVFPSGLRLVRSPPSYNETAHFGSPTPSLTFARRKRSPFKGPMLGLSTGHGSAGAATRGRDASVSSRTASITERRSGEVIQEEDENDFEEVDAFSPVAGPGEGADNDDSPFGGPLRSEA